MTSKALCIPSAVERFDIWYFDHARQVLDDWHKRHPPTRTVTPLPLWMHTEPIVRVMTNYEAQQQAEWDRAYS